MRNDWFVFWMWYDVTNYKPSRILWPAKSGLRPKTNLTKLSIIGCGYKPLTPVRGSRSHWVRPQSRVSKGKDTSKKGKMVTIIAFELKSCISLMKWYRQYMLQILLYLNNKLIPQQLQVDIRKINFDYDNFSIWKIFNIL